MRKLFFFAVAAAVVATSCSNDREVAGTTGENNGVAFRVVTEKGVKATETDINNIRDFKTFGFWGGDFKFMYKVDVVRGAANAWSYAPLRYWPATGVPANDKVDFYAYSPAGSRGVTTTFAATDTDPVVGYQVSTVNSLQEDFLVASALSQDKTNSPVQLTFKHALSQAVFQARSSVADVVFNITAVEFPAMLNSGNLDLSDVATGWTPGAAVSTYSAPITAVPVSYDADPTKYVTISGPNDGLMLLPQTITAGDGIDADTDGIPDDIATKHYLVVTYSAQVSTGAVIIPAGTKRYIPLAGVPSGKFEMGKKYTFQISMTAGLQPIVFVVNAVDAWVPAANVML